MQDPFEPHEPTDEEQQAYSENEAAANAPTVTISGLTIEAVRSAVGGAVLSRFSSTELQNQVRRKLNEHVEAVCAQVSTSVVEDAVSVEVQRILDDGIPSFDLYSGKETSRTSVSAMISAALTKQQQGDAYSKRGTILESMIAKKIETLFDKEFSKVVEEAKAGFKAQVDAVMKAKLAESLKSALGIS